MSDFGDNDEFAYQPEVPTGPALSSLAGMAEARSWGERVARDFGKYCAGRLKWADIDPACLIHGAPGTGKTMFAKALAATCKLPLVSSSFGEWQAAGDGNLGNCIGAMQATFRLAMDCRPCVLFIDELDSVPRRESGERNASYWIAFVNALLKAFDSLSDIEGVITISACNHPHLLDPALTRSGRMDHEIAIHLPNARELAEIIHFHLRSHERDDLCPFGPTSLAAVGQSAVGMSGADVVKFLRKARALARDERSKLTLAHLHEAVDPAGLRPTGAALRRIAIHEAGHALAAVRLGLSDEITASIIRRGAFDGFVRLRRAAAFCTPTELDDIIVCVLAGRAAEQHAFGDASTLSGGDASDSDLATATRYAADAVARHGFSDQGLFWHAPDGHLAGVRTPDYLRAAAMAKLNIAYTRALSLAAENDRALNKIADRLIERRVLTHAELASIFAGGPERPEPQQKPPRRFTAKPLSKLAVTPSNWDFPWNSQQTDNAARK